MAAARRTPPLAWVALLAALVLDVVSAYRATLAPASDVRTYRQWINGSVPSWTVPGPYPLGADLLWWPLRWVHGSLVESNLWWLVCCTVPVTLIACAVLWRTSARPVFAITVWLLAAGLLERSYWMRMEPVAALGALLMIVGLRRGRVAWPALALSAGALIKVWPVFLAPTALLILLGRDPSGRDRSGRVGWGRWRAPLRWTGWFVLPWAGYLAAIVALRPPHATAWATFTFSRRTQVESLSALPALWAMAAGSTRWTIRYVGGLDSTNIIVGPHLHAPRYALQSLGVVVLLVLAVRVVRWRLALRDAPSGPDGPVLAVVLSTQVAVLLVLIFAGPVFSPQYLVWFAAPLAVAAGAGLLGREVLVWLAGCALTFWEFPVLWLDLERGDPLAVAVLTARDAVLVVLLVLCLLRVRCATRRPAPGPAGRKAVDGGAPTSSDCSPAGGG
jgi:hypothetical protein